MSERNRIQSVEDAPSCDNVLFYAYGASYPDASCVDGRLQDDDETEYEHGDIPCPFCKPKEYAEYSDSRPIRYANLRTQKDEVYRP